jgi:hypothetical protein
MGYIFSAMRVMGVFMPWSALATLKKFSHLHAVAISPNKFYRYTSSEKSTFRYTAETAES